MDYSKKIFFPYLLLVPYIFFNVMEDDCLVLNQIPSELFSLFSRVAWSMSASLLAWMTNVTPMKVVLTESKEEEYNILLLMLAVSGHQITKKVQVIVDGSFFPLAVDREGKIDEGVAAVVLNLQVG